MQPIDDDILIKNARWDVESEREALLALRMKVFVEEQGVPADLEIDERDAPSQHFLAVRGGEPLGCVRLTPAGKITRLCVAKPARGHGIGSKLLAWAVGEARRAGMEPIYLHAQTHAGAFYERHGFAATGAPFVEAGIPHQKMVLQ